MMTIFTAMPPMSAPWAPRYCTGLTAPFPRQWKNRSGRHLPLPAINLRVCSPITTPREIDEMCFGLFIYDLGKSMVPEEILNKTAALAKDETKLMQKHANDFGFTVIEKNHLDSTVLSNMIRYHHGPIYEGEPGCYPFGLECGMMPPYVRICKLMDMYDAMISKRCYQDAR